MNYHHLLNMATRVGTCLLENGAEIYRVEESIQRIIHAYGVDSVDVFAVPGSIIVTLVTPDGKSITKNKRIHSRSINLDKVRELNNLSRRICNHPIELDEIQTELDRIRNCSTFPFPAQVFAYALTSFAFTLFWGGTLADGICAIFIGALLKLTIHHLDKLNTNSFFTSIIGSTLIAVLALLAVGLGLGDYMDMITIGTLMNLAPGVAITNSIRDIIAGDLMAGQTKMIEALLAGVAMALGPAIAISLFQLI